MSTGTPLNANQYIEVQLDDLLKKLEDKFDKDGFAFVGPLMYSTDDFVRDLIESRPTKRNALLVVLETTGGYIEPARRMVSVFRHHYSANVEFVVPSYAMSAGTVLAMSGDAIHMDYYATLGPIDP
ncbi:MAG: hypothetical protein QOJ65_2748, partial [Fimbriimonadaceae bacterium]|nr:hypothetical protein [Fimbriimonadaceae bacterium]